MKHSFVCLGFPKCATTTLDSILRQHPQIKLPCHKETLFFEREDLYRRGISWYESRYYGHSKSESFDKIYGEINPRNIGNGNCEKNVIKTFGEEVKLIYIIRNPVDALFSWFRNLTESAALYERCKDNVITENSFDDYVNSFLYSQKREDFRYRMGFAQYKYGCHLATALKYVPIENVYVVLFEDYIRDIENETKKILSFIGADINVEINYDVKENVGNRISKGEKALEASRKKYRFWHKFYVPYFPFMGEKIERMMDAWYWNIRIKATVPAGENERIYIHEETRKKLMEYYLSDVELLDKTLKSNYGKRWGFIRG